MKAAFIRQTGPPESIEFADLPDPAPAPGEVLVDVKAVSINPIDTYVRGGAVAFDLPSPFIVGCDAAGLVAGIGDGVEGVKIGDRVWCTNQGLLGRQGTFAERIVVGAEWLYPIPDGVEFADAAACALVSITAYLGLRREVDLQGGETVLVIGGAGGVGSMVIQMARALGGRVIATGGGPDKCARIRELGADVAIDYTNEAIADAVRREAPRGVNVFWETRRQPDFDLAVETLAPRGKMVLMAGRDARPAFPVGPFYVNELSLHGFVMFKATAVEMRAAAKKINAWMSSGKLQANIARTFPLAETAEAHRIQEAATLGETASLPGKIVLTT